MKVPAGHSKLRNHRDPAMKQRGQFCGEGAMVAQLQNPEWLGPEHYIHLFTIHTEGMD